MSGLKQRLLAIISLSYVFHITTCFLQSRVTPCWSRSILGSHLKPCENEDTAAISRSSFLVTLLTLPMAAQAETTSSLAETRSETFIASKDARETIQESISGVIAGSALTIAKTVVKYPLDTATVRLQMPKSDYSIQRPLDLLRDSYRGVLFPLLANIPAGAVFFGCKDACKSVLKQQQPGLPKWLATCIAVGFAQVPYWVVRNPSEVVKTRQQAKADGFGAGVSNLQAYQAVFDETRGIDSFYLGYWENILYAYPADVIKFVLYEGLLGGRKDVSPSEASIGGAISTAVAQLVTTPLDVVRNRIMANTSRGGSGTDEQDRLPQSSPSYVESLIQLGRDEGWRGLMTGAVPRVGKAFVSGAIQFATYEETKQQLAAMFVSRNAAR
jgi:solute carrier family 25 S-adenosylmethionine transporter 26